MFITVFMPPARPTDMTKILFPTAHFTVRRQLTSIIFGNVFLARLSEHGKKMPYYLFVTSHKSWLTCDDHRRCIIIVALETKVENSFEEAQAKKGV